MNNESEQKETNMCFSENKICCYILYYKSQNFDIIVIYKCIYLAHYYFILDFHSLLNHLISIELFDLTHSTSLL